MPARAHSRMKMGYTRPEGGHPGRLNCSATSLIYRLTRMLFGTLDCGTRRAPGSTHMSFLQLTSILLALTYPRISIQERDGSLAYSWRRIVDPRICTISTPAFGRIVA